MQYPEQEITDAYENGTLFIKSLATIEDDERIYTIAGNLYEVMGEVDNCWLIDVEDSLSDQLQILKTDEDFQLVVK